MYFSFLRSFLFYISPAKFLPLKRLGVMEQTPALADREHFPLDKSQQCILKAENFVEFS